MTVRVDLERLKYLSKRLSDLEVEARKKRREYGEMLLKVMELRHTIEGLSAHYGFNVELTPTGPGSDPSKDPTLPLVRRSPIRSDEDVEKLVEGGIAKDAMYFEAELPTPKRHWTPRKK